MSQVMATMIRPTTPNDFQGICDLILSEEELFLIYPEGEYPFTVPQVQDLVKKRIESTTLFDKGKVAGFANFYGYKKGRSIFIGNVVVDSSLRGRGLGRRIIQHMINLAFGKYDVPRVQISVYNQNTPALLLYASFGFKPYSLKAEKDYRGERIAKLTMRLRRRTDSEV